MLVPKARLPDLFSQIKERAASVQGISVVLIVAPDADALAACRMLVVRATVSGRLARQAGLGARRVRPIDPRHSVGS